MNGDNLDQNYPLRVLVGQIVRDGHLPLWDAFIWSGTPLLAGWNAGAAFPGTWLFAILPDIWAWAVNLLLVGLLGTIGTYVFLRRQPIGPTGAFIGSATFAFTGFMSGQSAHLRPRARHEPAPVRADRSRRDRPAPRATAPLGDVLGAGPARERGRGARGARGRAAGDLERRDRRRHLRARVVLAIARPGRPPAARARGRRRSRARALCSAVDARDSVPPGVRARRRRLPAVYTSGRWRRRGASSSSLPYLLGGYGNFGLPAYSGLSTCLSSASASGSSRSSRSSRCLPAALRRHSPSRLGVWYVLAIVGVVLALGTNTPVGHLLWHLPLFGGERLQNRNIVITDFALAVLVAFWADRLATDARPHGPGRRRGRHVAPASGRVARARSPSAAHARPARFPRSPSSSSSRVYLADPIGLERWLQVRQLRSGRAHELLGYLVPACVLAARRRRLRPRRPSPVASSAPPRARRPRRRRDRASSPPTVPMRSLPPSTHRRRRTRRPHSWPRSPGARAATPSTTRTSTSPRRPSRSRRSSVSSTSGILHHIASVQGYGSIVSEMYEDATVRPRGRQLRPAGARRHRRATCSTSARCSRARSYLAPGHPRRTAPSRSSPRVGRDSTSAQARRSSAAKRRRRPVPGSSCRGPSRTWFLPGDRRKGRVGHPRARPDRAARDPKTSRSLSSTRRPIGQRDRDGRRALGPRPSRRRASTWSSCPRQHARRRSDRRPRRRRRRESGRIGQDPARRNPADRPVGSPLAIRGDGRSAAGVHQHREPRAHLGRGPHASRSGRAAACRARPRDNGCRSRRRRMTRTVVTLADPGAARAEHRVRSRLVRRDPPASGGPSDLVPGARPRPCSGGSGAGWALCRHLGLPAGHGAPRGAVEPRRDAGLPCPVRPRVVSSPLTRRLGTTVA